MFTRTVSAGEVVGTVAGNAVVTVNCAAKAAVLAGACFIHGVKAGWLRATTVTEQDRSNAEACLALTCVAREP